jgi:hypothetical protein
MRMRAILIYFDIFWHILTYSDIFWHILTYSDIFWHILTYFDIFPAVHCFSGRPLECFGGRGTHSETPGWKSSGGRGWTWQSLCSQASLDRHDRLSLIGNLGVEYIISVLLRAETCRLPAKCVANIKYPISSCINSHDLLTSVGFLKLLKTFSGAHTSPLLNKALDSEKSFRSFETSNEDWSESRPVNSCTADAASSWYDMIWIDMIYYCNIL